MATINILVAVDGAKLAEQVADRKLSPGTKDSPTSLKSYSSSDVFISMIAPNSSIDNSDKNKNEGEGASELRITANGGDTVEWAITTFDNNFDQTPYIYKGHFTPSNAINIPLSFACGQAYTYLATGNPTSDTPTKFVNQVSTVSGTILKIGLQIQYTLSFALVDNATGNTIGYFTWDPFINVN